MPYELSELEKWALNASRKGEKMVVVIRKQVTGEEMVTDLDPLFVVSLTKEPAFSRPELQHP